MGSWRRHCSLCLVVDVPCNCSMQFKTWLVGSNYEQSLTDWYLNTVNRKIVSLITFGNLLYLVSKWCSFHAYTFPSTDIQNFLSFLFFCHLQLIWMKFCIFTEWINDEMQILCWLHPVTCKNTQRVAWLCIEIFTSLHTKLCYYTVAKPSFSFVTNEF